MTSLRTQVAVLVTLAQAVVDSRRSQDREAGMATAEWVILVGVVVAMAIAVGAVVVGKVTSKANSIPGL